MDDFPMEEKLVLAWTVVVLCALLPIFAPKEFAKFVGLWDRFWERVYWIVDGICDYTLRPFVWSFALIGGAGRGIKRMIPHRVAKYQCSCGTKVSPKQGNFCPKCGIEVPKTGLIQ